MKGRDRRIFDPHREGDVKGAGTETKMLALEIRGGGSKPGSAGRCQKLEGAWNRFSPRASGGRVPS